MSAPTKGMVAGQPIKTGAQSKEFDEGHERIFGPDRKPQRGRWVATPDGLVEVGSDWTDAERRAQTATEELVYGNARATDGTPINTRKRHREYLKSTGLAMASDFGPDWSQRVEKSRERTEDKARRETIERIWHKKTKP